jgi:hypothetical protein
MGIAFEHGSGNKAETIAELHGIWEGIYTTIGLRQGLSTEALRFASDRPLDRPACRPG